MSHHLAISPSGRLFLRETSSRESNEGVAISDISMDLLEKAFHKSAAHGLLALASRRKELQSLPVEYAFWREFADVFLAALSHVQEGDDGAAAVQIMMPAELGFDFTLRIPAMPGAEYASPDMFSMLWQEMEAVANLESKVAGGLRQWLQSINPSLQLLGKVTFHLAENKRSPETPFAFMATYTHRLSAQEKPVHLPLARALQEYAGAKNQAALRSLLEPVQKAAEASAWMRGQLESRRIFQAQAWTPAHAHAFLREVAGLEAGGITVRIPNWWKNNRGTRPQISVKVGDARNIGFGVESMLDFTVAATLDGEVLTEEEWQTLMNAQNGLVSLRGQWVEVDHEKLQTVLEQWKSVEAEAKAGGVSFLKAMRMMSGVPLGGGEDASAAETADWSEVMAGGWLHETLEQLRQPDRIQDFDPGAYLNAELRPYQATGVKWLWLLQRLGLGACLADDMGLGKTIQVIALLLQLKHQKYESRKKGESSVRPAASLLIAPASLLANWKNELARFAPELRVGFLHPSESPASQWRDAKVGRELLANHDLLITTYGQVVRLHWLAEEDWRLVILDEAQAIKNPGARQTKAIKLLRASARIALSGTPVENRLGDLWSLYDFLNPGLLGSAWEFGNCVKVLQSGVPPDFSSLRRLIRPYLLRRMKTDRSIIADLPDKTELTAWCALAKNQAALYEQSVRELAEKLETLSGLQRCSLVLAFLTRFKQICNHPSHWMGDDAYALEQSGKFQRLVELCEEIASRQEKVLIFTQFREMTGPLVALLGNVFRRPGLQLHGGTPIKERQKLVVEFQRDDGPPFFVLSLRAGGTGLTLTAASHVIHFDRWWNPAIENQATDRAFRIGQKRNVLVHKFVCRGTIEERIDALISDKKALADSLIGEGEGAEKLLTEMSNDELLQFVSLDLKSASVE